MSAPEPIKPLPINKNKIIIPHIDARTIEEISLENKQLKDQLKYNIKCLNEKRKLLMEKRRQTIFKKQIDKSRRIYAFRINADKLDPDIQTMIKETITNILKKDKIKMTQLLALNNFIWFKTNKGTHLNERIELKNGMTMEQINPNDFLSFQADIYNSFILK